MRRPRSGFIGLLGRHVRAHRGSMVLVSLLVAGLAFLSAAGPRALDVLLTDALRHDIAELVPVSRDLVGGGPGSPNRDLAANNWADLERLLADERGSMPPALRELTGQPSFTVTLPDRRAVAVTGPDSAISSRVVLGIDAHVADHVQMLDGQLPRPVLDELPSSTPVDFVLSSPAAEAMNWEVGDVRLLTGSSVADQTVRLSGTYRPVDPDGEFWTQTAAAIRPVITDDGVSRVVTATGWMDPRSWSNILPMTGGAAVQAWFPFHPDTLRSSDVPDIVDLLNAFTRQGVTVPGDDIDPGFGRFLIRPLTQLSFQTGTTATLRHVSRDDVSTSALATMVALGPLLAGVCAIYLAVGLLGSRQRSAVRLAWARGASDRQLRGTLAAQGLLAGVPAATIGCAVAVWLVPGRSGWLGVGLPVVVGLIPAIAMATSSPTPHTHGIARRSSRWLPEVIVIGLAAAAVVALHQRGLATNSAQSGVDPLLAATPVLLCLVGCVVALRLVRPVAEAVRAWIARRTGVVGLLGAARAAGTPTISVAVSLALVSGVGVAVFSATTVATLRGGVNVTAASRAGADIRIHSDDLTTTTLDTVQDLPGVLDVVDVSVRSSSRLVADRAMYINLISADVDALRRVQADVPHAPPLPATLTADTGDRVPVIVSRSLAQRLESTNAIIDGVPVRVVGEAPPDFPVTTSRTWMLADRDVLADRGLTLGLTSSLLVSTTAGASDDVIRRATALFDDATFSTPASERRLLEADPRLPGLRRVSTVVTITAGVLVLMAVAMALVAGSGARARDISVVRALGMPSGKSRWLPAWEVGPLAAVSATAGVLVGLAIPVVVLGSVDLVPFTGGSEQPALLLQPWGSLALLAGVLALTAMGALASSAVAGRRDMASDLRMMED